MRARSVATLFVRGSALKQKHGKPLHLNFRRIPHVQLSTTARRSPFLLNLTSCRPLSSQTRVAASVMTPWTARHSPVTKESRRYNHHLQFRSPPFPQPPIKMCGWHWTRAARSRAPQNHRDHSLLRSHRVPRWNYRPLHVCHEDFAANTGVALRLLASSTAILSTAAITMHNPPPSPSPKFSPSPAPSPASTPAKKLRKDPGSARRSLGLLERELQRPPSSDQCLARRMSRLPRLPAPTTTQTQRRAV